MHIEKEYTDGLKWVSAIAPVDVVRLVDNMRWQTIDVDWLISDLVNDIHKFKYYFLIDENKTYYCILIGQDSSICIDDMVIGNIEDDDEFIKLSKYCADFLNGNITAINNIIASTFNLEFSILKLGVIIINNIFMELHNLPENLIVNHTIHIEQYSMSFKLPNKMIINGDLDLYSSNTEKLPDDLIINGDLYWISMDNELDKPKNMKISGKVILEL